VYVDAGISGGEFERRPGLLRLPEGAKRRPRPFDVVVVMSIDRLGREQVRTAGVVQALREVGVAVWTYQDGRGVRFDTPIEKLMVGIGGFGAEDFRYQIREKTRSTLREKAKRGHAVGPAVFGYHLVRRGGHSERQVHPEQAAVVVRCFEMAAAGFGDLRIARTFAADGVPAPCPAGWQKDVVRKLLARDVYRGVVVYGKQRVVDCAGRVDHRERVPADDWIGVDVPYLRIVSDALWARVQARKAKTRTHYLRAKDGTLLGKPESGLTAAHLLSGIARCSACGGPLVYVKKPAGISRYHCGMRQRRGPSGCTNPHGVPAVALEQGVRQSLYEMLSNDGQALADLLQERDDRLRREQEQGDGREAALAQVADIEKEIGRLVAALASGTASSDVTAAIAERRAKVEALKATPAEPPRFDRLKFLQMFAGTRRIDMYLAPEYGPAQARQALRRLGATKIVVYPDGADGWVFQGTADLAGYVFNKEVPEDAGFAIWISPLKAGWSGSAQQRGGTTPFFRSSSVLKLKPSAPM
jgi:site-specific DNA recombinase